MLSFARQHTNADWSARMLVKCETGSEAEADRLSPSLVPAEGFHCTCQAFAVCVRFALFDLLFEMKRMFHATSG